MSMSNQAPTMNQEPAKEATKGDAKRVKRALLITFHFPPQSVSSGVQRSLSFTKDLPKFGWQPLVLSAMPIAYEETNPSQLARIPKDVVVKRTFSFNAKRHLSIAGRYPEIIALPDRWVSWIVSAVPVGWSMIKRYRPQVIWTTFPISTTLLIGLCLKRLTGLPWVVDFRDPMLQPEYPTRPLQRKIYRWIEKNTINSCNKAMFTTMRTCLAYQEQFPSCPREKFVVIENGYDEEEFAAAEKIKETTKKSEEHKIVLLHSGVLYAEGRDPSAFLGAIALLKESGTLSKENFQVVLRAPGDLHYFMNLAIQYSVHDIVDVRAHLSYQEALIEMLSVDGLLLFQGTPYNHQIPAKVYEYLRAKKPILGMVDIAGDTADALRAFGLKDMADMNSIEEISLALKTFIDEIRLGKSCIPTQTVIEEASRRHRARQLAMLFDELTKAKP